MDTETGLLAAAGEDESEQCRRGGDRREPVERRRGWSGRRGLFEFRADREGTSIDRRRGERRDGAGRSWWSFWRRDA